MGFLVSSSPLLVLFTILGLTCAEGQLRLCVTSIAEMSKCETFNNISCVLAADGIDCVQKINDGEANITTLDGGDIYLAGKCHNMKPIIAECSNGTETGAGYYAVAVAKRSSNITINTLEGKNSCHTGVNKTAGWFIPMSILFSNKSDQIGQALDFFGKSCVPGATPGSNLCKMCKHNCSRNSDNIYYGYDGAALCLQENADADVAFVKHVTFLSNPQRGDYQLLCKNGSRAEIEDYLDCNLARVPSHAVVAKDSITLNEINDIYQQLNQTAESKLFSQAFGKNMIFSSSTTSLNTTYNDYVQYLGQDYLKAVPEQVC